jgi:Ca2+-binding RTX toxin-like protein
MATRFFTSSTFGAGVQWNVASDDGVYVAKDVTVGSTDDFAVTGTGDDISIDIDGTLYGDQGGLSLTSTSDASVKIGSEGQIGGDLANATAIGLTDFDGSIGNQGLVSGETGLDLAGNLGATVQNRGTIIGTESAIRVEAGSTGSFTLFNFGTIDTPVDSGAFSSLIVSRGKVNDVILDAGVINGFVSLGGGSDIFAATQAKAMSGAAGAFFAFLGGVEKIGVFIDGGDGADQLSGSRFTDELIGSKGNDTLQGGGGDDELLGGLGKDDLTGGKGADFFVFSGAGESRDKEFDTIHGFNQKENDILSFSEIDAHPGTPDDDEFKFIGTDNFSGKAGELRYEIVGKQTIVFGNLDHDKQAEFEVHLEGKIHLQQGDFGL